MRYFEAVYAKNIFYEKNVYLLIHDLFHDFEIMLDDTKANLELRKLERTYWSMITTSLTSTLISSFVASIWLPKKYLILKKTFQLILTM